MDTLSSITLSPGSETMIQAKATKTDWRDSNIASKTITVYSGTVATPEITDNHDGTFTLSCATDGASIYYNVGDGTQDNPTESTGTLYSEQVTATIGQTVKAFAVKQYYLDSAVAEDELNEDSWSPADITNVESWYDANDATTITVDGSDNITEWVDKIGAGKPFATEGANHTPSYDSVNKKAVFDASNSEFLTRIDDGLSGTSNLSVAVVLKPTATASANQHILAHYVGAGKSVALYLSNTLAAAIGNPTASLINVGTDITETASDYKLLLFNYIKSGTSRVDAFKCGVAAADAYGTGASGAYDMGTNSLYFGAAQTPTGVYLNADVKTLIIVQGTIGVEDLAALKTYCNTEYGADC